MTFSDPPPTAGWRHRDARDGFEVVFFGARGGAPGIRQVTGYTSAVEAGQAWFVRYEIQLTGGWLTAGARASGRSAIGAHEVTVESAGTGRWLVNGVEAPYLDGCLDVDFESSALTNAFPVHRLALQVGERSSAPAVYVRALDLAVERLEQEYLRVGDQDGNQCYDYIAPAFGVECRLRYDDSGLVTTYPGIAVRIS